APSLRISLRRLASSGDRLLDQRSPDELEERLREFRQGLRPPRPERGDLSSYGSASFDPRNRADGLKIGRIPLTRHAVWRAKFEIFPAAGDYEGARWSQQGCRWFKRGPLKPPLRAGNRGGPRRNANSEQFRPASWTWQPGRWQADDVVIREEGSPNVRHGTAGVRNAARRRGGGVAAAGAGPAGAAHRRADGSCRQRSRGAITRGRGRTRLTGTGMDPGT